jgi:hypothetical protein
MVTVFVGGQSGRDWGILPAWRESFVRNHRLKSGLEE